VRQNSKAPAGKPVKRFNRRHFGASTIGQELQEQCLGQGGVLEFGQVEACWARDGAASPARRT
jgi:hypothetical protein